MATTKKTLSVLAVQTTNADGSITIRPIALADGRANQGGRALVERAYRFAIRNSRS